MIPINLESLSPRYLLEHDRVVGSWQSGADGTQLDQTSSTNDDVLGKLIISVHQVIMVKESNVSLNHYCLMLFTGVECLKVALFSIKILVLIFCIIFHAVISYSFSFTCIIAILNKNKLPTYYM